MRVIAVICAALLMGTQAWADPLEGTKSVKLVPSDGDPIEIASVTFSGAGGGYQITMNDVVFTDHFLSMRPFKCLESPEKHWCHVPYPYEIKRSVYADDLTDLEYDLLFVWKGATEYGINLWNGVYYRLSVDGDRLVGRMYEMDMDKLGVPPDDGNLRPIRKVDLEEGDPDSHWLPRVLIE